MTLCGGDTTVKVRCTSRTETKSMRAVDAPKVGCSSMTAGRKPEWCSGFMNLENAMTCAVPRMRQ